jgi:hypothetical protein
MRHLKILSFILLIASHVTGQSLIKDFDMSFGGYGSEFNVGFIRCSQGGFAMLVASTSDSSFEKSQNNRDSTGSTYDYWFVRFDAQGNKLWDRTYGGSSSDIPSAICELANGDFILAGTSSSPISHEKSEISRGGNDFWILRVDSIGNVVWDKTIGGSANDNCKAVTITSNGKIFCAGYTLSTVSGDKTTPLIGLQVAFDFWLVSLNQNGQIQFDQTLGSTQNDNCNSIVASNSGGAILMGYSDSPAGFNKSQNSRGLYDYWVIAVDNTGNKIWDKTIGGDDEDYGYCVYKTADAIYVGGDSYSGVGFDKTASNKGLDDIWLIKLSLTGSIIWDQSFGSFDSDELNTISMNSDNSILLSGESYSSAGFDKSENNMGPEQLWMIQVDTAGNKLMDKTFFSFGHDEEGMALESSPGNYIGCITSVAGIGGYKSFPNYGLDDVWVCSLKPAVAILEIEPDDVKIFPNPISSGQIQIQTKLKSGEVKLYDLRGVELVSESSISLENYWMDISAFSDGVYILRIQTSTVVLTKRIIVEHQ